jgi:polyhydroxybutyrate depolymerase
MRTAVLALALVVVLAPLAAGCGDESGGEQELPDQYLFGGERPTELYIPADYTQSKSWPLLIVLHGHGASGYVQLGYTRLNTLIDGAGVLALAPDGLLAEDGKQFWNATDACCDTFGSGVDDSAYIRGLIDEVTSVYNVDPDRVYLWGHSNGGFMAHRMACDHADAVAAIVSLAGSTWLDSTQCNPSEPVNVMQIHGDADATVPYTGRANYPGAEDTVAYWADNAGCGTARTTDSTRVDIDTAVAGDETRIERHDGCPVGIDVELWAAEGTGHIPMFTPDFPDMMWAWFEAHPKQ